MRTPQDEQRYLDTSTSVDEFDLNGEFVRLPADLHYWNGKYAAAYEHWQHCKEGSARLHAAIAASIRQAQPREPGKRSGITVAEVEDLILLDPQYQQARAKEIAAEAEKIRLYGVVDAVRAKKEMVISLGAQMRSEMAHMPSMRGDADNYISRQADVANGGFGRSTR